MKNIKNILLVILISLFLCLAVSLKADSGWDADYDYDYDYGSSNWDYDWDDYDYGSSNTHNYYRRQSSDDDIVVALVALGVFIVFGIVITKIIISQTSKTNARKDNHNICSYDVNKIKEILPEFNIDEFRQSTYELYKNIQTAWTNFDYDELKKYTTNELYNLYKSELTALKVKKQKNIMSNFNLQSFDIVDMENSSNSISIKVRMSISCLDYVVNDKEEVVRGNKARIVLYNYEMTFTKGLSTKDNKCPNCNAPLDNNVSTTCPYCNSTVISNNHDWVLSKKQIINQKII